MSDPVIITCAVTGSAPTRDKNPAVPVTPAEIAHSALDAAAAGAAMVHIHVRDPETGASRGELGLYREVCDLIEASGSDVIVNISTGFGGFFSPGAENPLVGSGNLMAPLPRVAHVIDLAPEVCSLDVGTANFGERVFMNTVPHLREMSAAIRDAGVKPEIEVFEAGHIVFARHLIEKGLLAAPPTSSCAWASHGACPQPVRRLISWSGCCPQMQRGACSASAVRNSRWSVKACARAGTFASDWKTTSILNPVSLPHQMRRSSNARRRSFTKKAAALPLRRRPALCSACGQRCE